MTSKSDIEREIREQQREISRCENELSNCQTFGTPWIEHRNIAEAKSRIRELERELARME
jgi:predicted RNase H-like nuclease (RuvC/YqgF family)